MKKSLILYFSRDGQNYVNEEVEFLPEGNCSRAARYIQEATGADMFRIEPAEEYPPDYYETVSVVQEQLHTHARPPLKRELKSLDGYTDIYIVGPLWWGTYPMPMFTQLEKLDFTGKRVHALLSHEGSGFVDSQRDLRRILKGATFSEPLAVHGADTKQDKTIIQEWARKE